MPFAQPVAHNDQILYILRKRLRNFNE